MYLFLFNNNFLIRFCISLAEILTNFYGNFSRNRNSLGICFAEFWVFVTLVVVVVLAWFGHTSNAHGYTMNALWPHKIPPHLKSWGFVVGLEGGSFQVLRIRRSAVVYIYMSFLKLTDWLVFAAAVVFVDFGYKIVKLDFVTVFGIFFARKLV